MKILLIATLIIVPLMAIYIVTGDLLTKPKSVPVSIPKLKVSNYHVLFFTAPWCSACRRVKPGVEQLKAQGYNITIVDCDSNGELVKEYEVTTIPLFVILENNIEIKRISGIDILTDYLEKKNGS